MTLTQTLPCIDGTNWTVDRPYANTRYSWSSEEWTVVIRDVGCAFLWRLHARNKTTGEELVYGRDDHGNNQDGLDGQRTLFAAAFRLLAGRARDSEVWTPVRTPSLHDSFFASLGEA